MNKTNPLVSIVLPTHNGSKYIRRSIESCLEQAYDNIELVIIDDGSLDDTAGIINSYKDPRVIYAKNEKNIGLPRSLNKGFLLARGQYLTWTSDDNFYAPKAIEKMLNFLQDNHADFVYCDYFTFEGDAQGQAKMVSIPDKVTFRQLNFVRACFMYTRRVQDCVGSYDHEAELSEDYDYWIRVSKCFKLEHLKEPLYYYRTHSQALYSRRFWEQEAVKCMVRFRHGLFSLKEAADFLVRLYVRKKSRILRPFFYLSGYLFLKGIFLRLLERFSEGASFTQSRGAILERIK